MSFIRSTLKLRGSRDDNVDSTAREVGTLTADVAVVALSVAKNSADWNPILKSVLGGLAEIIDLCRVSVFHGPQLVLLHRAGVAISGQRSGLERTSG